MGSNVFIVVNISSTKFSWDLKDTTITAKYQAFSFISAQGRFNSQVRQDLMFTMKVFQEY